MNCQDSQRLIHAYSDGELDLMKSLEVEQHLAACAGCSRTRDNLQTLHSAVNSTALYFNAPTTLQSSITVALRATVKSQPVRRISSWSWQWRAAALPLAAAIALAVFVAPLFKQQSADNLLARELTASHIRSLMAMHLMDVASTDQHTVKPWFDGKLDFAPPVKDFKAEGFPLTGGRLDYIGERSVAALIYQRQKHVINLFIWPAADTKHTSVEAEKMQGYNLIRWENAGMKFWAVSDLNESELRNFAKLSEETSP